MSTAQKTDWPGDPAPARGPAPGGYAVLANAASGRGAEPLDGALERLRATGADAEVVRPKQARDIPRLVGAAVARQQTVVIAGGDGTLNAALPGLLKSERPFGVLPFGTANDFARTIGVGLDVDVAANVIAAGHARRIDVGVVNDRPFLNAMHIGFAVEVARHHRGRRKQVLGVLSYPLAWWEAFQRNRPFAVRLVCDGNSMRARCVTLAVANGVHYGGGMIIDEHARIDDSSLDLYLVKPAGVLQFLLMLPAFRFGTLWRKERAVTLSARQVEIATRKPRALSIDGELGGTTPARCHVLPGALQVYAPAP